MKNTKKIKDLEERIYSLNTIIIAKDSVQKIKKQETIQCFDEKMNCVYSLFHKVNKFSYSEVLSSEFNTKLNNLINVLNEELNEFAL